MSRVRYVERESVAEGGMWLRRVSVVVGERGTEYRDARAVEFWTAE